MGYFICKKCHRLLEDTKHCIKCGSNEFSIYDVLLSLKGTSFSFKQDTKDSSKWEVISSGKINTCVVEKEDTKISFDLRVPTYRFKYTISCDCLDYQIRGVCKHTIVLESYLKEQVKNKIALSELDTTAPKFKREDIEKLISILDKGILKDVKYEVAGSYRRKCDLCRDIDILVEGFKKSVLLDRLEKKYPDGNKAKAGDFIPPELNSAAHIIRWYIPIFEGGSDIKLDIHFATPVEFSSILLYFTGSRGFNENMRDVAISKGYILNEKGLWNSKNTDDLIARGEKEIFKALDIKYKEPENRN